MPRLRHSLAFLLSGFLAACTTNQTFPGHDAYVPGDGGVLSCVPDLDGVISADELSAAPGVPQSLLVSPSGTERAVNVAGIIINEQRVWDLSIDYADDTLAHIEAASLRDQWFADRFPAGQFVAPLDVASSTLGVYRHDDRALWLLGIASAEESPARGQTLFVYSSPVELYRFPITPGDEHVSVGEVSGGTLLGLPYAGRDTYEVSVVGAGRLELPDLIFDQAIRVDTRVTVAPVVGAASSRRQVSWLSECFGEVARATSRPDETNPDFDVAAELRRLSLEF